MASSIRSSWSARTHICTRHASARLGSDSLSLAQQATRILLAGEERFLICLRADRSLSSAFYETLFELRDAIGLLANEAEYQHSRRPLIGETPQPVVPPPPPFMSLAASVSPVNDYSLASADAVIDLNDVLDDNSSYTPTES